MSHLRPALLAALLLLPTLAPAALPPQGTAAGTAAGNAARGKDIVAHGTAGGVLPCMVCHGTDLAGNPAIGAPRLAGLPQATTLAALAAIAAGKQGKNYVMRNIAHALTGADRADIAAYLASLPEAD
ncbi:c-type cytochrome [Acidiphilium multivorum]|uniref:c-type cytochrome n=1 Tax=Acidiphilium multivorum TaxID=62140 RepID=UPI001F4C2949|nr:c-type cytochrome [Acidiphilium multivorum]UNC15747.1 c-type cytochrome [Acidiphilium multivorum]